MRTLRQLSYTGTTLLLFSVGTLTMGCSGALDPGPGHDEVDPNDIDGDGIPNDQDPDIDGDGIPNDQDPDDDNDGIPDEMDMDITPPLMGTGGNVGAGTGGSTAAGGSGTGGSGGVVTTCVPGVPATSQVPRLTNLTYENAVRDLLGLETLSDGSRPSQLLLADSVGVMEPYAWTAYQNTAGKIAAEVMGSDLKSNFMSCDPGTDPSCYQNTIVEFGRKMFRRPLEQVEVDSFLRLTTLEPAGTPAEISEAILFAFLVSPSFIMVPEVSEALATPGVQIPLTSHQVAMRLSLAIWGSVPDEELSLAADAGMLTSKEQVLAQATRMIQDRDRASAQIAAAHRKYLNVSDSTHWWQNIPDPTKYPQYKDGSLPVLQQELDLFFEEVAFNQGTFSDLFLSNVGFVNQDTAAIYGLNPADYGPEIERVEFAPGERPGFLTRAGFLVSKSHVDSTSPILRGAFVTIDVLGVNPGAPSADALTTPIPPGDYQTQRQVIDSLTSAPSCKKCHQEFINPPGFVLERYNAAGVIQEADTSWLPDGPSALAGAVDTSATVSFSANNVKMVSSPQELMQEIVAESEPPRLYAQKLVSFVMNRLPNENDACLVNDLATKLTTVDGYTILNTFSDMAQADSFLVRTVGN